MEKNDILGPRRLRLNRKCQVFYASAEPTNLPTSVTQNQGDVNWELSLIHNLYGNLSRLNN